MNDDVYAAGGLADELGRDMALADSLEALDPASHDPNYWFRFRGSVMSEAARELARRRVLLQLTVGDVLNSWARAVVPTAVLAATLAGLMLMRSDVGTTPQPVGVEELLVTEVPMESVPMLLTPDEASGFVAFASDIF